MPVFERIRSDREKAHPLVKCVFTYLEDHLFDPDLDAEQVWTKLEIKSKSIRRLFRRAARKALAFYIRARRMQAANQLLYHTKLTCTDVGLAVGYGDYSTFNNACHKVNKGRTPLQVRRAGPPSSDPPAPPGEEALDDAGARDLLLDLAARHPSIWGAMRALCQEHGAGPRAPIWVLPGEMHYEMYGLGLWLKLQHLPYDEQLRLLRENREVLRTPMLFEELRKAARIEGRRDRQRGIQLVELALVCLEGGERVFGDRVHQLRALGLATLGNQHRLAGDLSEAMAAFEKCDREWRRASAPHDPKIAGEIAMLRGSLFISLRKYEEAVDLVERARDEFRRVGHREGEVQCLIQLGSIQLCADRLADAVRSFLEAQDLVGDLDAPYLACAAAFGLANAHGRLGNLAAAEEHLARAKELQDAASDPSGAHHVKHLEGSLRHDSGDLEAAERMYSEAHQGFVAAAVMPAAAIVGLDLALLYAERNEWDKVLGVAGDSIPMLASLKLHPEALSALELLGKAIAAREVPLELLQEAREHLKRDPLLYLT